MKFFSLLCLIGLSVVCASELRWDSGKTYEFEYQGRMLTGLPELSTYYAGMGLNCKVLLQVLGGNKFAMQVKEAKYTRVNQVLRPASSAEGPMNAQTNWRVLALPSVTPVPSESASILGKTALFEMNGSGEAQNIVISQEEPTWSINFKKALVSLFVTKVAENKAQLETNTVSKGGNHHMSPMSWVVNEESIDGTCSVIYQLNELPAYLAKDSSSRNNNGTFKCDQGTTYELTKTKDVNSCSKRATFMNYKPGFFSCPAGNCDGQWSRSSITRYVACGTSGPQNLEIKAIINEGEFNLDLLGFKTEKVLSGTKQVLELLSKKKTGTPFPQPSQPKTFDNLRYVYSSWEMPHSQSVEHGLEKGVLSGLNLEKPAPFRSLPRHTLTAPQWRNGSHDGTAQLIPQIEKYVTELVIVDLEKAENIAQKQVTMKVLTIARGLTVLSEDQIKQVYNKLKGNFNSSPEQLTTFKNVMFDCMIMSGSSSAMKVLKPLIESGELSDSQTAAVFMFLPTYIVTPTQELLSQIFELVKSSRVNKSNLVYSHALMSFSTLIQKACIAENRKTSYPTFVYGEFCNQDSQIVVQQWIPYLQSELQKHSSAGNVERMNVALVSLGVLGHKNIIPVVLPFVESGSEQYQKEGPLSRFLAVSSLGVVGQMHPETVAPLALSIFGNLGESTEVRVAAFNVLLKLDPPTVILQKIASITWYETNMEVLKVVNTALLSLSREYNMAIVNTKIGHLQKRCSLIYPLIKKIEGAFPTSGSVFTSDYLNELGVGFVGLTSWISSPSSTLPQNIYAKLVYFLDRYQYSPMAVNVRTSGMDTVVRTLSEIIRHPSESKESIQENLKQQLSGEWRKTVEKLNIQSRGGSGFSASLFMQLFEDNALFYNFDTVSEQFIREKMTPYMKNPSLLKSKVGGETPINFQRMLDFGPSEYLVPSDMGMPFVIEAHMPVVISFKGTANIETGATIPAVNMKVKTIFAAQYTGWAGTICPFTDETVLIGIDEHSVLNIPGEVNIELKPQEQKLKVNIKPLTANQPIDIFHFHVRPFGVTQKFWDLTPFTISKGMQLINSATPTTKITRDVGEYIGLNLNAIITTQSPFTTKSGLVDKLRLYKYNPLNFIRFFWASSALSEVNKPSIRMHEFELRFDPSHEGINDIEMLFQLGTASKVHGEPAKYHAVKVDEEKKSSSSLPYAIESKPMSEVSSGIHAERSEKIEKMFQKLSLDSGSGFSLMYSLTLKGPRPRTWTYSLSAAAGSQGIQQKWDIQAESQKSSKKVCFSGTATIPTVPVWKLEEIRNSNAQFTVQSTFGFGSTCQESQIKLSTVSQVSDEQKEFSRTSPEAKEFRQRKSEGKHSELSELAEKVRSQASTTDKVQLKVQFVSVPKDVLYYSESVVTFFKAYWWKYMTESHGAAKFDGNSQVINIGFSLKPANKAVAVTMSRPDEKVVWTNIPLPYSFCWIMGWPSSAATTQAEGGHRPHHHEQQQQQTGLTSSVGGSIQSRIRSVLPGGPLPGSTCIVEGSTLETVTKKSIKLALDDCFYLLAADCSEKKSWGLLMRPVGPSKGKDLKLFYGKTTLLLNPTVQSATGPSPVEVTVDGSKVTIAKGASYIVKDDKKTQVMKITKTPDDVIKVESPKVIFLFDGVKVQIQITDEIKKSCGMCGRHAHTKAESLQGPNKCLYSKPELLAASYRVSTGDKACKPLPANIEKELKEEKEACMKAKVIPTKVMSTFKSTAGQCTQHVNQILTKADDVCFSRFPVVSCGNGCKPQGPMVNKSVSYTCMPKKNNKKADFIIAKIHAGKIVPELKSYPETFKSQVQMPVTCTKA